MQSSSIPVHFSPVFESALEDLAVDGISGSFMIPWIRSKSIPKGSIPLPY
ncbi:MAG: hypothetical protein ABSG38_08130 [Spirochaetia bacterium]